MATDAPCHGIQPRSQATGQAGRIIAQGKELRPHDLESATVQKDLDVLYAEVEKVPRNVKTVPGASKQEKLPAGSVRNLNDQTSVVPNWPDRKGVPERETW